MDQARQDSLFKYLRYMTDSHANYQKIGESVKYVTHFLEHVETVNRRGYMRYKIEFGCGIARHNPWLDCIHAWLKPGGTVAAITSTHWTLGQEKACIDFKDWIKRVDAHTYEIGEGQFASSGTKVNTMAIVITKKQSDNER